MTPARYRAGGDEALQRAIDDKWEQPKPLIFRKFIEDYRAAIPCGAKNGPREVVGRLLVPYRVNPRPSLL